MGNAEIKASLTDDSQNFLFLAEFGQKGTLHEPVSRKGTKSHRSIFTEHVEYLRSDSFSKKARLGVPTVVDSSKVHSEGKSELFGSGCDTTNTHCCQY